RRRHHGREYPPPSQRAPADGPPRRARGPARGARGRPPADVRRAHHHDRVRADPHLPADRGEALPADGGDDLGRRRGRPPAHAHAHPRAVDVLLPPPATGTREPAAPLAAPALHAGHPLVRTPSRVPPPRPPPPLPA